MKIRQDSLCLLLWVATPLVVNLAQMTAYPNQIYILYEIFEICLAAVILKRFVQAVRIQLKWVAVLLLYSLTFIVVSYYGVDFDTSIEYGVYYQPLVIVLEFSVAFIIGYLFDERRTFKYLRLFAFVLMAYTLLDIELEPDRSRFVTNLNIPMAIPLFVFARQGFFALLAVLVLLLSLKKTIVACGLLSLALAYLLRSYVLRRETSTGARRRLTPARLIAAIATVTFVFAATAFIMLRFSTNLSATMARFSEPEDTSRAAIAAYSLILLVQNFPYGIGWFGFLYMSIGVIRYDVTDARGEVRPGAPLHNSYMTWALEGGLPVVLIVTFLFWHFLRTIRRLLRHEESALIGATALIWLLSGMLFGAFQQWHSSATFWLLFGFVFGSYERYRRLYAADHSALDSHA
jgi:hypothetical protein